jgi:hypothetical protein
MPPTALKEDHGDHETQAEQGCVTELQQLRKKRMSMHGALASSG